MGTDACNLLEVEVELDRVEAQLAAELPAHMRAFARSYLAGAPPPAAPDAAGRVSSIAIGRRALAHPVLADRGLALLRLVVPTMIERDAAVTAARAATPSWPAWQALVAARDAAARARFQCGVIEVLHALHGSAGSDVPDAPFEVPARIAGWSEPEVSNEAPIDDAAVAEAWRVLAARHGVPGVLRVERGAVRPRAFVVEPRAEVIVAVPRVIDTPATRFAVLHELGHAVANLLAHPGIPRVADEAAASLIARAMEQPGLLDACWASPLAVAARARRTQLARALAAIERSLGAAHPPFAPPWALWHDPGAQAAYIAAESLADRWVRALGPTPAPGALEELLADERARIDRDTVI